MMLRRSGPVVLALTLSLAAASCGGSTGEAGSTSAAVATTASPTTAAAVTTSLPAASATTAAPATTVAEAPDAGDASGANLIELRAKDLQYIGEDGAVIPPGGRLAMTAGVATTVTLTHSDIEPHNFHVRAAGEVIQKPDGSLVTDYFTPIKDAPSSESLTFTITEPGEYQFFCDTHPLDMTGTLVVTS